MCIFFTYLGIGVDPLAVEDLQSKRLHPGHPSPLLQQLHTQLLEPGGQIVCFQEPLFMHSSLPWLDWSTFNLSPSFRQSLQKQSAHKIHTPALRSWRTSLVAQMLKNPSAMQETWVQFLDWEDPLEKETATHSSILAWKIPWTEKPGGLQSLVW